MLLAPPAHDALPDCGRAGFVGTKSIKQGDGLTASLDYIVDHDGAIIEAVSQKAWSGEARVVVSIVNWLRAAHPQSSVTCGSKNGNQRLKLDLITSSLSPNIDVHNARDLSKGARKNLVQGQTQGVTDAFELTTVEAARLARREPAVEQVMHPFLGGKELVNGRSRLLRIATPALRPSRSVGPT